MRSVVPLRLTHYSLVNALGDGRAATLQALQQQRSGLRRNDLDGVDLPTWIGRVDALETTAVPGALKAFDCRNNRLAERALQADGFDLAVAQARRRYGAERIGLFIGTSTSGIATTEQAFAQRFAQSTDPQAKLAAEFDYRHTHNSASVAEYLRQRLQLGGPATVVATACSSSAKVFAMAQRQIAMGWIDAAVVGGVDSLCQTTLYGFNALQLVSASRCCPWDAERDGINIGEAAGLALLEPGESDDGQVDLLGVGESSDAYHMSTPHPEGDGAVQAIEAALAQAGLQPQQIDYINLHGTSTPSNDRSEDRAICRVFGRQTPCSSTKGWTGHTLGAAGISEAIIVALCIEQGLLPTSLNTRRKDPQLEAAIVLESRQQPVRYAVSNSFGFGGSNCSLVLGRRG